MVAEVIGGALMMVGGGLLSASSLGFAQPPREDPAEPVRDALGRVYDGTTREPLPADLVAILNCIP